MSTLLPHEADVCAALPDIDAPGIATVVFETIGAEIPASAEMVWKTRPLLPHASVNSGSYSLR